MSYFTKADEWRLGYTQSIVTEVPVAGVRIDTVGMPTLLGMSCASYASAVDCGPAPYMLLARTVKLYYVPPVNPVTKYDVMRPVAISL